MRAPSTRCKSFTIIALLIAFFIQIISMPVNADDAGMNGGNTNGAHLTEESLFYFAPSYLINTSYDTEYAEMQGYCYEVVDSISSSDRFWAGVFGALKDGDTIIVNQMLSNLTGDDSFGITSSNNKKLAGYVLKEYFSIDSIDIGFVKDLDKGFDVIRETYSTSQAVGKDQLNTINDELKKLGKSYLSDEQIDEIFSDTKIYNKILGYYSDFADICEVYVTCLEIYQYDLGSVDTLMRYIDPNSELYDGLSQIREDMTSDPADYMLNNYLCDKLIGELAGDGRTLLLENLGATLTTDYSIAMLLGKALGTVYESFNPSYKDIFNAYMMQSYVKYADSAVSSIRQDAITDLYTQQSLKDYKCCYNFYLACLKIWMQKCLKVVSNDSAIKGELESRIGSFDDNYSYNQYMLDCLSSANTAYAAGNLNLADRAVTKMDDTGVLYAVQPNDNLGLNIGVVGFVLYDESLNNLNGEEYADWLEYTGQQIDSGVINYTCNIPSEMFGLPVVCVDNTYNSDTNDYNYVRNELGIFGDDCGLFILSTSLGLWWSDDTEHEVKYIVNIPDSVTSIGDGAFSLDSISSISIPDSVTRIGESAFAGCDYLTSITIPDSVTSIGAEAFRGCDSLVTVIIPDTVTEIGAGALEGCDSLTNVTLPIADGAVFGNSIGNSNVTVTLSDSLTEIGDYAFAYCGIQTIIIPDSVTSIGSHAFYQCDSLQYIDIPDSVTVIGESAFEDCDNLTDVVLPQGITKLEDRTFYNSVKLSDIVIPNSVTEIGYSAFEGCSGLSSVAIPDSVTTIGDSAFENCTSLASILIPDSVTTIKDEAFMNCASLSNVMLSNAPVKIGEFAFSGCSSLISIDIPSSVSKIDQLAFGSPHNDYPFASLTDIYYEGTMEDWKYLRSYGMTTNFWTSLGLDINDYGKLIIVPDNCLVHFNCDLSSTDNNGTTTQFTVCFITNGGSYISNQTIDYGKKAKMPSVPVKTGYTFGGWYTNSSCTTAYSFNSSVTENITLYAKWTAVSTPTPTPKATTTPTTTPTPVPTAAPTPTPTPASVSSAELLVGGGKAHVQDIGDTPVSVDPNTGILTIGTTGMGKRLEEITINFVNTTPYSGTLEYRVHVQDIGWMDWVEAGSPAGTEGMGKRIEAIELRLTGELAEYYSVEYCVHIQDYGDMQGWVKDGALAGTTGESKRIEEIKIRIVPKGSGETMSVKYRVHVQDYGWEKSYASNGTMSGTSGESKRLEGIEIFLSGTQYSGGIKFKTHVQDYGWQGWSYDGEMSGTQGESKRLEGICIELYGEIAEYYDIYYRVHAQDIGWMAWAKNGECAGTAGRSARLEGIQIVLVPKGSPAPGATYEGITAVTDKAFIEGF